MARALKSRARLIIRGRWAAVQPAVAILGPLSFRSSKMLREKQDGSRRAALVSDILLAQDKAEHQSK